jgi:putative transport protein
VVFLGGLTVLGLHFITGTNMPVLVGVMSGAVTNTPGLGAAQEALKQVSSGITAQGVPEIGMGYAVAYPFGVIGIILMMILIRKAYNINIHQELERFDSYQHPKENLPERVCLQVTDLQWSGKSILEISQELHLRFVITRVMHEGEILAARSDTLIHQGDIIMVVAEKGVIPEIISKLGKKSSEDLACKSERLVSRQILVTQRHVCGKNIGALKIRSKYNVNITRIYRSGIELIATPQLRLQMGDKVTVVGDETCVEQLANELGNSLRRLNEPNIVPIFIGIFLGVILGSIPILIPGIPNPVRLGLAGGPLIVAILISKYGYRFSLVSYVTPSASLMLREIGIVLFLASVGIKSGEKFIPTLLSGDGLVWMGYGALITVIPLMITGIFARKFMKKNYFEICGLLSGSMTDPPALAFANSIAQSEAPAVAYATVYPLVMFLRIFMAQLLILMFA